MGSGADGLSRRRPSLSYPRIICLTCLALLLWVGAVIGIGWLRADEIRVARDDAASLIAAARTDAADHPGNLALVVIDRGRVAGTYFRSIGRPVDADTLFQMASVSKWVTAWGVLTLVDAGKVDLDAPVSRYLRRWRLPSTSFDNDKVTLRTLLSHTAGFTDGLGYCGFAPGQSLQPLTASLTAAADACPFVDGAVKVGAAPGDWRYSGGGYALMQLIIEDVTGRSFADYMTATVLRPLGMQRSTFRPRALGATNVAEFFDSDGTPAPHYAYTAAAAAALYTSAADLTRFVNAHRPGDDGEPAGRGVLSPSMLATMQAPQATILGRSHWGLGVRLYAPARSGGTIFGHDGGNVPAVNTSVRLDPATGDAIIALSTGGSGVATRLTSAWLRQRVDADDLPEGAFNPFALLAQAWGLRTWIIGGGALIMLAGAAAIIRTARGKPYLAK